LSPSWNRNKCCEHQRAQGGESQMHIKAT
jgi:hypothetical protein